MTLLNHVIAQLALVAGLAAPAAAVPDTQTMFRDKPMLQNVLADPAPAPLVAEQAAPKVVAPPATPAPVQRNSGLLACIRRYESRGNYSAVSPTGKHRGAYQMDLPTWRSVGGVGDPARASVAEQDKRAQILLSRRGLAPWPTPRRLCR